MSLTFANAWLLSFLALGALPVLIHLFARRRPRRVPISSLNFIARVNRQTQRMRRPRDIVILVLRTLLILALVTLFALPVLHTKASLSRSRPMDRAVLVIDRSLSMQCNEGGLTRFGAAQATALQVLDLLPASAQANVVWVDSSYETTADALTDNLELLRRDIEGQTVSYEAAAPQPALDKAVSLLGSQNGRIYVFSDFQTTNWKNVRFDRLPLNVQLLRWAGGRPETPNLSVSRIQIVPSSPVAGETFRITAQVSNLGAAPVEQNVLLEMGTLIEEQKIALAPYSQGTVSFECSVKDRATVPVRVSVPEDSLSADNTAYATVTVSPAIQVGVCPLVRDPGLSLLEDALAAGGSGTSLIQMTELPANPSPLEGLSNLKRRGLDIVFLYGWDGQDVERLDRAMDECDTAFVWMLPSAAARAKGVNSAFFAGHGIDLAVQDWKTPPAGGRLSLEVADLKSPLLDVFDEGRSGDFRASSFQGACLLRGQGGHTILAYDDGTPALSAVDLLQRKFYVWNIPLDPAVTNFADSNVFLPLVQELVRQNRTQKTPPPFVTGQAITLPLPVDADAGSLQVELSQGGEPRRVAAGPLVLQEDNQLHAFLARAAEPGLYKFLDRSGPIHLAAVNVPEVESDLRCLTGDDLASGAAPGALITADESIQAVHKGVPLWPHLLALSVVLFLGESLLLALWKVKA